MVGVCPMARREARLAGRGVLPAARDGCPEARGVVELPAATVVLPKLEVTVKPLGTLIGSNKVRSVLPVFCTVNVFVTGDPTSVVPKLTVPVPSAMSAELSWTLISGAVGAGAVAGWQQ